MRLLTLNSLRCPAKDVAKGFPLGLELEAMEVKESEFNEEFIRHMLPSLDWECILIAANAVGLQGIPQTFDPSLLDDTAFLQALHNLLLDVHVTKGKLVCPESGRKFPIENGLPDMM